MEMHQPATPKRTSKTRVVGPALALALLASALVVGVAAPASAHDCNAFLPTACDDLFLQCSNGAGEPAHDHSTLLGKCRSAKP